MYELYSFVEHTLYSRPVIRAVLFDTQFCLILKTEYNPHYNSTKMNMFSSSYNLLSTYECLSSKSQMYFPFITLYWFCSSMILACTIQKLFKICFILINLWFLTWTTLQLTSQVSGDQWNIIQGFPVTLSTDNLQNARSLITAADMDARKWRHTELFWISDKCKENKLKIKKQKRINVHLFMTEIKIMMKSGLHIFVKVYMRFKGNKTDLNSINFFCGVIWYIQSLDKIAFIEAKL